MKLVKYLSLLGLIFAGLAASAATLKCPSLHNDQYGDLKAVIIPTSIMGPTMDWKPIREGAKEFNINDSSIDEVLSAGVEIECGEKTDPEYTALNGWFLGNYKDGFFSNAHAVAHDGALRGNIADCKARSLLEMEKMVEAGGSSSDATSYSIDSSSGKIKAKTLDPENGIVVDDRAYVPMKDKIPGVGTLKYRPMPIIKNGMEIFLISRQNNTLKNQMGDLGPMIQRGVVKDMDPANGTTPRQIYFEGDSLNGDSTALVCIRDPKDPTKLKPVGIHEGSSNQIGDYQDWNKETNSGYAIGFDQPFFSVGPN